MYLTNELSLQTQGVGTCIMAWMNQISKWRMSQIWKVWEVSSQVSAQLTLRLPQPFSLPFFSTGRKELHLRTKSYCMKLGWTCESPQKSFKNLLYLGSSSGEVSWIKEQILCTRTFNLSLRLWSCVVRVNVCCIELCYYFGLTRTSGTFGEANIYPLFYI